MSYFNQFIQLSLTLIHRSVLDEYAVVFALVQKSCKRTDCGRLTGDCVEWRSLDNCSWRARLGVWHCLCIHIALSIIFSRLVDLSLLWVKLWKLIEFENLINFARVMRTLHLSHFCYNTCTHIWKHIVRVFDSHCIYKCMLRIWTSVKLNMKYA